MADDVSLDDVLASEAFQLDDFMRHLVQHAIARAGGNKAAAARMLGVTRRRMYSLLGSSAGEASGDPEGG